MQAQVQSTQPKKRSALHYVNVPTKRVRTENGHDADPQKQQDMTLTDQFDSKVRPFIDLVDDLRQYGLEKDISLPSIVVIGDQSSGKSSILEAISGVQLPRGSGIVTRCPLEMKLKRSARNSRLKWSARIQYTTAGGFNVDLQTESPKDLETLIRNAQDEIAGIKNGISNNRISLKVTSKQCPDLTLIDLPGIARTPVEGQPLNICDQIKNLLREYIENPQTIILCVIASNVDIAVNEALTLAKNHDEDGIRTLGVLTKPDLVDRGTENDVLAILSNDRYHLKKGFSIVRCRGQQEITDGSTLSDALTKEKDFFDTHRHFHSVPDYQKGIQQLAVKLTDNLVQHIQRTLPKLYEDVDEKLKQTSLTLAELGAGLPNSNSGKRAHLMKMISNVVVTVENLIIKGGIVPLSVIQSSKANPLPELKKISSYNMVNSGWGWRHRFNKMRSEIENRTFNELQAGKFHVHNLAAALDIFRGRELQPFLNFELFESLVRDHIVTYNEILTQCLEDVNKDTHAFVLYACEKHLESLPKALDTVKNIVEVSRRESLERGHDLMELEIQKEQLVYVQDQTFSNEITNKLRSNNDRKRVDPTEVQEIVSDYMKIANRRISDSVPMLIRTTQHHHFFNLLRDRLQAMVAEDGIEKIVKEDHKLESKRKIMEAKRERLNNAKRRLNESQEIGIDISLRSDYI